MPSEPIGFIGLGAMGVPMARRLAGLGYELVVHDLTPSAVQSVVDCGARSAPRRRQSRPRQTVFACLPLFFEALREPVLGGEGLHVGETIEDACRLLQAGAHFAREMAALARRAASRWSTRRSRAA